MPVRMTGLVSNMDTESIISSLMSVQRTKSTKIENKITKSEWRQEKWKALNSKIYSFYTDSLSKLKMQSSFMTKKVASTDDTIATVTASNTAPEGTHTLRVKELASAQFVTSGQLTTDENSKAISSTTLLTDLNMTAGNQISVTTGTTTTKLDVTATATVGDLVAKLKEAGLNASYDTTQKRFFISSKSSGNTNAFSLNATNPAELAGLKLGAITRTDNGDGTYTVAGGGAATLITPKDATYTYNGTELKSPTNNVSINGLSLTLKSVTGGWDTPSTADDEVVNLSVTNDTQTVYNMVKSFVTKYNELLKEMNGSYYAANASSFQPLTDDEKEAMTDEDVKKWEDKIKDSLLRKDSSLGSVMDSMKAKMTSGVTVDGKTYALSSYGIKTSTDYTEKGILHIDGNADDSTTAIKDDKLLVALNANPDTVMKVMTELAGGLYKSMTESMTSTSMRSALTFYNDKEITKSVRADKEDLAEMEKYLKRMEDRYYKQYAAMETALAKMNNQSSSLASMLGNGN